MTSDTLLEDNFHALAAENWLGLSRPHLCEDEMCVGMVPACSVRCGQRGGGFHEWRFADAGRPCEDL